MKTRRKTLRIRYPIAIVILFTLLQGVLYAQDSEILTLEDCYELAEKNYPLVKQYELIKKTEEFTLSNASKGYLPQIKVGATSTYQSDVAQLPFKIPNIEIPTLSKDQYKVQVELIQPITDLFILKHQKEVIKAKKDVETESVYIEIYKLKERINQLFFGILLMDRQIEQTEILKKDIKLGIEKITVAIANGSALKSSVDLLKAEYLKADQHTIELKAGRKGYIDILSLFINKNNNELIDIKMPEAIKIISTINRPELKMFEIQKNLFEAQNNLVNDKTLPNLSFFVQGGYGKPALNILDKDFDWYYIGGLKLYWDISSFYTFKKEKRIISLNQQSLDIQKETFLFNTDITLKQKITEISKLEELIEKDKGIVELRESVKKSAQNQLEYGTINTNDYLTYINAEDLAKQNLLLHKIQLLMAQYEHKINSGN